MTSATTIFRLNDFILAQSIILIIVAVFAVWMCFLVILVVLKMTLLHRNVRILLANAFSAAILNTIAQSVVASYNIAYYFYPADVKLNKSQCFILTFSLVPSYRLFMEFLGILAMEHCLSTFLRLRERRSLFLTLTLVLSLYFLNGFFVIKSLTNVTKVSNQSVEFCNSFFTVDSSTQSFDICVYTVVQVALAILFCLIYRANVRQYALNFTINTASHNLHERFINWSNIKMMSDLLPFLIYQTLLAALVNFCSIILLATNWSRNLDQKTVYTLMFMNLTRTGNFFLSSLIWMLKNEKMRAKLIELKISCLLSRFRNTKTKVQIYCLKDESCEQKIHQVSRNRCKNVTVVPFQMGPNVSNDVLSNVWAAKKLRVKKKL